MALHLNETEYAKLVQNQSEGKIKISMPTLAARQFFTHMKYNEVKEITGRSITLKKLLIFAIIVSSPIVFIFFILSVNHHFASSYASLIVPFAGITWIVLYGLASDKGGWLPGNISLLLAVCAYIFLDKTFGLPIILFTLSIVLQRISYLLSSYWLLDIIMHSYSAYAMLADHISMGNKK